MAKYNPNDTAVTLDGVYITGMGEDMIEFEFDEERFEAVVGAQGDVVVNETNNRLATFTLTIQATSPQYKMCLDYARKQKEFPIWGVNKSVGERFGGLPCSMSEFRRLYPKRTKSPYHSATDNPPNEATPRNPQHHLP